jgi:uncharacterized protein (DUF1015 family)
MEHTHANLSPIFGLISDPVFLFDHSIDAVTAYAPLADVDEVLPNGQTVRHILWRVDDKLTEDRIKNIVANSPVIIADGHHRYETAVEYHTRRPEVEAAKYMMMFISNLQSEGTIILPTHRLLHDAPDFNQFRVLKKLEERFILTQFTTREEGVAALDRDENSWALTEFAEDPKYVLVSDSETKSRGERRIAAGRLEDEILKPIIGLSTEAIDAKSNLLYPHSLHEIDEMKESAAWDAAFILRPVWADEMLEVVQNGSYMPQKSTYFYPKLLTGLVLHEFEAQ